MMGLALGVYLLIWIAVLIRASRKRQLKPVGIWMMNQVLLIGALAMLVPFYWMAVNSFKPAQEALRYPPTWWPEQARFSEVGKFVSQISHNYRDAWNSPPGDLTFGRYFWVSASTGFLTTAGTLLTSILAAYPLAKMNFIGKSAIFYFVLATLIVPSQVLMIPNYLILERLGWLDRYPALVVPFLASIFAIFLLRQFFMTVPDELWDAARLDGAGRWHYLWRVLVPLARSPLATIAILTFLAQWNALLWPLIATTRPEMRTVMVGLQEFNQEAVNEPNLLMAAAVIVMIPVILAFVFLQRFFIQSVARAGIKG